MGFEFDLFYFGGPVMGVRFSSDVPFMGSVDHIDHPMAPPNGCRAFSRLRCDSEFGRSGTAHGTQVLDGYVWALWDNPTSLLWLRLEMIMK